MFKKTICSLVALVFTLMLMVPVSTALASNNDYKVRARMSGTTLMSGQAKYRERTKNNILEQRFSVQVEDGTPGATVTVKLNDLTLGTIVLDDFGMGELQFRTTVDDPGDGSPIPSGFPKVLVGDTISVGDISGSFS